MLGTTTSSCAALGVSDERQNEKPSMGPHTYQADFRVTLQRRDAEMSLPIYRHRFTRAGRELRQSAVRLAVKHGRRVGGAPRGRIRVCSRDGSRAKGVRGSKPAVQHGGRQVYRANPFFQTGWPVVPLRLAQRRRPFYIDPMTSILHGIKKTCKTFQTTVDATAPAGFSGTSNP
jgi:hypothetical protein